MKDEEQNVDIKVGDVVQLKSGGPLMTVGYLHYDGSGEKHEAQCEWWSEGAYSFDDFHVCVLQKIDPKNE